MPFIDLNDFISQWLPKKHKQTYNDYYTGKLNSA